MDYCSIEQLTGGEGLTGYLPAVTSDEDKAKLAEIITRVSRRIDAYVTDGQVENYFAPAADAASSKVIRGAGLSYLTIPEHVVSTVSTVTAPAAYSVPAFAEEGSTLLCVDSDGRRLRSLVWVEGVPYTVTARWGALSLPADIVEAALQLVVRTYRKVDEGFSGVIGDIQTVNGLIERSMPPAVKEVLDVHRRKYRSRRLVF